MSPLSLPAFFSPPQSHEQINKATNSLNTPHTIVLVGPTFTSTTMVNLRSPFLSNLSSFITLLFHLGCFIFTSSCSSSTNHLHRRNSSSSSPFKTTKKTISSFFTHLFSKPTPHPPPSFPSPSSSIRSLRVNPSTEDNKTPMQNLSDIFPCSICGLILQNHNLLQHHKSTNHAVSELIDGENIVRIIFKTGWPDTAKSPVIHRILKIHNGPKIILRFEEYREIVKSRAASKLLRDERCIADGNELLRFYCTTFMCDLDSGICNQPYCSVCGIIRNGFSPKMDGIITLPTSWKAHMAVPEDLEDDFGFMGVKRALLLCRVVAGRVGCDPVLADKEDPGYDSLLGRGGDDEDELLVFNPRAVLPCFVIVYKVL